MSSWLSLSIPNPFKSSSSDSDADDDDPNNSNYANNSMSVPSASHTPEALNPTPTSPPPSISDDLAVFSQTLSSHLRGVASFLAPPPLPTTDFNDDSVNSGHGNNDSDNINIDISGIKNDLVEFKGSLNKAVSGFSKFASNFLPFDRDDGDQQQEEDEEDEDDEDEDEIVGINQEVVDFVHKISFRPELWTDFPLSLPNEFDMSDNQREHASAIEHFVPSLLAMKEKHCDDISDGQFWMIYFILLLPRLNEADSDLLSTPEIVKVRETLLEKLQNKNNTPTEAPENTEVLNGSEGDDVEKRQTTDPSESEDVSSEMQHTAGKQRNVDIEKSERRAEEDEANRCTSSAAWEPSSNEDDDVSFSDLEDDDNDLSDRLSRTKLEQRKQDSSPNEANEWIQLSGSSGGREGKKPGPSTSREKDSEDESSDWLTVDDVDLDSLAVS